MRSRGIKTALLSNCAENTRDLLERLTLTPLVDAVVLSWEVGYAKPDREIHKESLHRLHAHRSNTTLPGRSRVCAGQTHDHEACLLIICGSPVSYYAPTGASPQADREGEPRRPYCPGTHMLPSSMRTGWKRARRN